MTSSPRFIHLRTHTEYSLLEGALRLKKLSDLCKSADMPAIAVTDTNNMFSALEFSVTLSDAGIQPILGCQVDFTYQKAAPGEKPRTPAPLVLLAQSEAGYENLMKLNSCLYLDKGPVKLNPRSMKAIIFFEAVTPGKHSHSRATARMLR